MFFAKQTRLSGTVEQQLHRRVCPSATASGANAHAFEVGTDISQCRPRPAA
jgi:hypothetical protein